jgi:hypothetical protein
MDQMTLADRKSTKDSCPKPRPITVLKLGNFANSANWADHSDQRMPSRTHSLQSFFTKIAHRFRCHQSFLTFHIPKPSLKLNHPNTTHSNQSTNSLDPKTLKHLSFYGRARKKPTTIIGR